MSARFVHTHSRRAITGSMPSMILPLAVERRRERWRNHFSADAENRTGHCSVITPLPHRSPFLSWPSCVRPSTREPVVTPCRWSCIQILFSRSIKKASLCISLFYCHLQTCLSAIQCWFSSGLNDTQLHLTRILSAQGVKDLNSGACHQVTLES